MEGNEEVIQNAQEEPEIPQINIEIPQNIDQIAQDVLALLNEPDFIDEIFQMELQQQNIADLTPKPLNLLMAAIEAENIQEVKEILHNFIIVSTKTTKEPSDPEITLHINEKIDHDGLITSPVLLAHSKGNFDIVQLLLEANSTIPFDYPILNDDVELPASMRTFFKTMNTFHRYVHEENLEKLSEMIDENPNLRHFYNLGGDSAPMHAVKYLKFDVYEFLIAKNLDFGSREDVFEYLLPKQKEAIKNYEVNFQGHKVKLKDILTDNFDGILTTPQIISILKKQEFFIGEEIKLDFHAFESAICNDGAIIRRAAEAYYQTITISDYPKTGRTTLVKQMAIGRKVESVERWVVYVDLKTWWRKEFNNFDDLKKVFCKDDLEEAIFMKAYADNTVVFFWDGGDEMEDEEFEKFIGELWPFY